MLQTSNELRDFSIAASDGDIGQVEAFCFDDREWMVRYILVNTGGWLHPRKVLISPSAIGSVDATARGITTDFTREEVKTSPKIEADRPGSRQEAMRDESCKSPQVWGAVRFPHPVSTQGEGDSRASNNRKKSSSSTLLRSTHSPEYDESSIIDRAYEERLYQHWPNGILGRLMRCRSNRAECLGTKSKESCDYPSPMVRSPHALNHCQQFGGNPHGT
jgi:hypothetical protein